MNPNPDAARLATTTAADEVAIRLQAIGTLGNHVAHGRVAPGEAVATSVELLAHALMHAEGQA